MKLLATLFLVCLSAGAFAQQNGFPFGEPVFRYFEQKAPANDTSAVAIIVNEFGEAHVSSEGDHNLIFEHHYLIKILKQAGVEEANIAIPIYKSDKSSEKIISIEAASYNIVDNKIQQTLLSQKNIFTENTEKYVDLKKFTIPNVRVGSVIEVYYTLETPFFVRNFRKWEFQSHLPKLQSEYWASIPGNYNYNISLTGFLKLKKNESVIIKDCFQAGGNKSDCARFKYSMQNIPAFIEEDYMTASSNFISAVDFELLEIKYFDGRIDKVTNDWEDADQEMIRDPKFGLQLRKGKDLNQKIAPLLQGVTDPLEKAKKIYDFIKSWYTWNHYYGKYSDLGIKKAFDAKTGNIADINLSLIAAMQSNGLDAEPVVLSTRENGLPTDLFPVLSDFNYVIAKLKIGDKTYLLDASDEFLPFGMLPERCLNGRGRVFTDKRPSYWIDLKPTEKYQRVTILDLELQPSGVFTGTIEHSYRGYSAFEKRKRIASFSSQDDYLTDMKKKLTSITINKYEVKGEKDINSPVVEKFEVEIEGFDNLNSENLLLNPFFTGKIEQNPFRSNERLYPVDYGAPLETSIVLNLTYPTSIVLVSGPEKVNISLPNAGGKYLFDVNEVGNRLTVNYVLSINKTLFSSQEYNALKEMYNRVIQTQQTDFLFKQNK
jgi:hypothetical protein